MKNRRNIKGEQNLQYNLTIWEKNDAFDIINDISENVTLVKLMDSLGNVNHDISIVGNWIFESNYKKALCLKKELLYLICPPSIGEEIVATFDPYFMLLYTVGQKFILEKDKHDTVKEETKYRKTYEDPYYIYILIFYNSVMKN